MEHRPTKPQLHEHRVVCPHCKSDIVVSSIMEHIIVARRNCPACKIEMLIKDDRAVRIPEAKKPPKRVKKADLD